MEDFLRRLIFTALLLPFWAWIFMLCEGSLALMYGWPTISYGHALVACIGLSALLGLALSAITYELVGFAEDRK